MDSRQVIVGAGAASVVDGASTVGTSATAPNIMTANLDSRHFNAVEGPRTAHLIIDMQVGFMEPGSTFEVPASRTIIPNINRISRAVRETGGVNAFLRFTADPQEPNRWTAFHELNATRVREMSEEAFHPSSRLHGLSPELDVGVADIVLDKTRPSAFIAGTCRLQPILAQRKINTLVISGTLTNCCCESTARDAAQMNYRVLFLSDANAALTQEEHEATLRNLTTFCFADVRCADEVLALLRRDSGGVGSP